MSVKSKSNPQAMRPSRPGYSEAQNREKHRSIYSLLVMWPWLRYDMDLLISLKHRLNAFLEWLCKVASRV